MKTLRSLYNPQFSANGLTHDKLSRSAWKLAGLDPVERQRDAQDRLARALSRRDRSGAAITAALAVAWLVAVIAATA